MNEKNLALVEKLNQFYKENGLAVTAYLEPTDDPMFVNQDSVIEVEINWGDWKHQHLRCELLTEQFLKEDYDLYHKKEVTEEDDSDCYSAIHRFHFTPYEV